MSADPATEPQWVDWTPPILAAIPGQPGHYAMPERLYGFRVVSSTPLDEMTLWKVTLTRPGGSMVYELAVEACPRGFGWQRLPDIVVGPTVLTVTEANGAPVTEGLEVQASGRTGSMR